MWWRDLHVNWRQSAPMGGIVRLTGHDLRAWSEEEIGRPLRMWERKAVMAIEAEWQRITSEQNARRQNEGGKKK